jgi:putative ABC transport system permease protein
MRGVDIIKRAGRNLRQAKGRTFLTSLAIAVGSFTIMMSLAAGTGTREYSTKLIESTIDPQTLMVSKGKDSLTSTRASQTGLQEYGASKDPTTGFDMIVKEDVDHLKAMEGVDWVEPYQQITTDWVQFDGNDKKYTMKLGAYDAYIRSDVVAGSLPSQGQQIELGDIVLPSSYAEILKKDPSQLVGTKVVITASSKTDMPSEEEMQQLFATGGMEAIQARTSGESKDFVFTVRAIAKTNQSSAIMMGGDSTAQISRESAQQIADYATKGTKQYQQYYSAVVRAKDGVDPVDLKNRIKDGDKYDSMTAEDMQQMIFQFVNVLQYIVFGFGVLALIASVFGIINTQYISVLERTSQVGLMKALGMPNSGVGKLFRYEAAWIGFLGGLIGVVLAYGAVLLLNPWITDTLDLGEGNYLLKFEWLQAVILIAALIFVAIAAGWLPARKAAKLDPVEALRTE